MGKGKFGQVYLAREKKSKFIIALKAQYKSEIISNSTQYQLEREIGIHSHLRLEMCAVINKETNIFKGILIFYVYLAFFMTTVECILYLNMLQEVTYLV